MATVRDIHVVPLVPVLESEFWVIRDESSSKSRWVFVVVVVVDQTCIIVFKVQNLNQNLEEGLISSGQRWEDSSGHKYSAIVIIQARH